MHRRLLLGALCALPSLVQAAPATVQFRVLRAGTAVGTHIVRFRDEGVVLVAESEVRISVRLAGFTVFRYAHDTAEHWQGPRLLALTSRLERNGTTSLSEARATGDSLALRGAAGEVRLPGNAAPLTWWRVATLAPGVPLFDPRRGEAVMPALQRSAVAGGTLVKLIGGEGAEVLFDPTGTWIGFATTGEDGSAVRYERA